MVKDLRKTIGDVMDNMSHYISKHPIFGGLGLILAYFIFDNEFMIGSGTTLASDHVVLFSIFASYFAYYIVYLRNKLKEDLSGKDKKIEVIFFISLAIVPLIIFYGYDTLITKYLPSISDLYKKSEVIVFLVLAPIFEELAFRFMLYDKWAKPKYGKIVGGLAIGLVFIISHPINGFVGFVVYWLPTLFLFMTYDLGGIKASIVAHLLFNIVALL